MTVIGSNGTRRRENLALLYQDLFSAITHIQSGQLSGTDAETFRGATIQALADITREAFNRNYTAEQTMDGDFAVVALLDETIKTSPDAVPDAVRDAWMRKPLEEELFGVSTAGEVFFDRVAELLQCDDTPKWADVLEVYYLSIMLGFEGRYATRDKAELASLSELMWQKIERIRQVDSPAEEPLDEIVRMKPDTTAQVLEFAALSIGGAAILVFLCAWVFLWLKAVQLQDLLVKALSA